MVIGKHTRGPAGHRTSSCGPRALEGCSGSAVAGYATSPAMEKATFGRVKMEDQPSAVMVHSACTRLPVCGEQCCFLDSEPADEDTGLSGERTAEF